MRWMIFLAALAAGPAFAQQQGGQDAQLPSETACNAVRERVQLALAQADRALQAENTPDVQTWSAIGASYAGIYASFCQGGAG